MAAEEGDDNSGIWGAIGTALIGGVLSGYGQKDTNETNLQLGREQMGFQERMSNTAYQRAVKDMAAAGINPMLASQVGGATSPSGAMPQVQNALGAGVNGAKQGMEVAQQVQAIEQSKAQADQLKAQSDKIRSETMDQNLNTAALAAKIQHDKDSAQQLRQLAQKTTSETTNLNITGEELSRALRQRLKDDTWSAESAKKIAESKREQMQLSKEKAYKDYYDSPAGRAEPYIGLGTDVISSASQAKRAFGPERRR